MKKLLSVVLILSILALFYNNVINRHFHKLPNGIIVEHAHPFNKAASPSDSPFENHHHTNLEYLMLDMVYHSGLILVMALIFLRFFRKSINTCPLPGTEKFLSGVLSTLPLLRAPPANRFS
jgi:hypothetical protein